MARNIYDDILRDARVKLTEMFDNNFREQGFFGQKWVATKVSKVNKRGKGSILIVTGAMRRSIRSMVRGMSVVFSSHLPYTALHNEGGNFSVTVRAHSRTNKKTGNTCTVRSHSRQMTIRSASSSATTKRCSRLSATSFIKTSKSSPNDSRKTSIEEDEIKAF